MADVAVFGIPGRRVGGAGAGRGAARGGPAARARTWPPDILASLDGKLARLKWPAAIEFTAELPRDPSGKLLKRRLREPYWQAAGRSI